MRYLYLSLYLLDKVKKVNWQSWDWVSMEKECKKYLITPTKVDGDLENETLVYTIFNQMVVDGLPRTGGWIETTPHVIPYLGYFTFFKGILKSIIKYGDENKEKGSFIDTWEGVVEYFIGCIKYKDKEIDKLVTSDTKKEILAYVNKHSRTNVKR